MPAWSALAWFEEAWAPGAWALVAPPPPPPAPAYTLPLPAKLLGRAPKKKRERPNVTFKPPEELRREEADAPPAPEREPEITPAPPPREEIVALAPLEREEALLLVAPEPDLAALRDAVLALAVPMAPELQEQPETSGDAGVALSQVEKQEVAAPPPSYTSRALFAMAGRLAAEQAERTRLEGQVQALQTEVFALRAAVRGLASSVGELQADQAARALEEAENERRRTAALRIADELDD